MGLFGGRKPAGERGATSTAPTEDVPKPSPKVTRSPKKPDPPAVETKQSRIASVPLKSTLHYRFSDAVSAEKRLRNRAAQGDDLEVRRLVGMGANVNATNDVRAFPARKPCSKPRARRLFDLVLVCARMCVYVCIYARACVCVCVCVCVCRRAFRRCTWPRGGATSKYSPYLSG